MVSITRSAWAFAFGAWMGVRMTRIPSERRTSSNDRLNFVSRSRMRNRTGLGRASGSRTRLRACWVTQAESGCAVDGLKGDPPAPELDEHEDVQRPEPGGLHAEDVAGDDPVGLSPQELGPGWAAAARGRTKPRGPGQGPD